MLGLLAYRELDDAIGFFAIFRRFRSICNLHRGFPITEGRPTPLSEPLQKRRNSRLPFQVAFRKVHQHANPSLSLKLLRVRRERPSRPRRQASVMKWRRSMSDVGLLPPWRRQSVYLPLNRPKRRPQVLGADLNCSEWRLRRCKRLSDTLANALQTKLRRLLGGEPRLAERIDVHSLNAVGPRLYKAHVGPATIASRDLVRELMQEAASAVGGHKFGQHFLLTEWEQVVDAWPSRDLMWLKPADNRGLFAGRDYLQRHLYDCAFGARRHILRNW
jgi:hypothetical protein